MLLEALDAGIHPLLQIIGRYSRRGFAWKCNQAYIWFLQIRLTIPRPLLIQGIQILTGDAYRKGGCSADIYLAQFKGKPVAVKVPRITRVNKVEIIRDFINEVMIMDTLGHHQHIIDLFGVSLDRNTGIPCIITPWMDYGTLADVIRLKPTAEYRQIMASIPSIISWDIDIEPEALDSQIEQVVDGMTFLKLSNVVHGDLKCSNVLITNDGRACIADFGLAHFSGATPSMLASGLPAPKFLRDAISWILQCNVSGFLESKTSLGAGSPRWMAPERLWPDRWGFLSARATFESDVFSLGMMIYEIYSAKVPFFSCNDAMSIVLIVEGGRPRRPRLVNDRLWNLAERCWNAHPAARPYIESIRHEIQQGPHHGFNENKGWNFQVPPGTDVPSHLEISAFIPVEAESFQMK